MKRIALLVSALLPVLFAVSCVKEGKENGKDAVPAVLGVEVKDALSIYEVPKNQSVSISLIVTADPVSEEAYTISLGTKANLVASYNSANGTSYELLPSTAYTLSSSTLMLTRYSAKSTACELRLSGNGCEQDKVYVLPVVIEGVQGGTNFSAPDDKAAYILFKMLKAEQLGSGTEADPYLVDGLESFLKINGLLKDDASNYFKLTADIDFSEVEFNEENPWTPINKAAADLAEGEKDPALSRIIYFEGDNHKISSFKAGGPIFGVLVGSVQNLVIENAAIDAVANDAAIVAAHAGTDPSSTAVVAKNITITKSSVYSDYKRAGALISWLKGGVVENCVTECAVSAQQQVGGLIGRVEGGSIINCSASGKVTSESYYSGGLVGIVTYPSADAVSTVTITGCHATGDVEHLTGNYSRAGGLVGEIQCNLNVEKCYATGNVTGSGHYAGGLFGTVNADKAESIEVNVSRSYATGKVSLPHGESGNWAHAGGLLGSVIKGGATITDCYSTGAIENRRYSGGFVGSVSKDMKLVVKNGYSTSDISGIVLQDRCGQFLGQANGAAAITCSGFIAWDIAKTRFCYLDEVSTEGNYFGSEGTVSEQAKKLNWSTDVWDLTGDLPKLK